MYTPFDEVPELDWLQEDMDAAKDDLYFAKSFLICGTGQCVVAPSTFVAFSLDALKALTSLALEGLDPGLVATGAGVGRAHSLLVEQVSVTGL